MGRATVSISLALSLVAAVTIGLSRAASTAQASIVEGAWEARRYHLASGEVHPLRGQIVFSGDRWQVLFFVLGADGEPRRGSGEGGSFTLQGETLTFRHELHLSSGEALPGLAASDLRMSVRAPEAATEEPARVRVQGDTMVIWFPSGNRIGFERPPGDG